VVIVGALVVRKEGDYNMDIICDSCNIGAWMWFDSHNDGYFCSVCDNFIPVDYLGNLLKDA